MYAYAFVLGIHHWNKEWDMVRAIFEQISIPRTKTLISLGQILVSPNL